MNIKVRLILMNFLQFAVWGAYVISMGGFLAKIGIGSNIGWFYSIQGIVSLFMPAIIGIIADRWVEAQRLLAACHAIAAAAMAYVGYIAMGEGVTFADIFPYYTLSIAFYMPTLALSNSVSYNALEQAKLDSVKAFPPIRVFGTIGFIVSMLIVDKMGVQRSYEQFFISVAWQILLVPYALTLPHCRIKREEKHRDLVDALGLRAFALFKEKRMAIFFIFSMFLGVCLQITNGYANTFISSFEADEAFTGAYFVKHANSLISLSQLSETFCILLIPFFMGRFGIKRVMLIAMLAWVVRFGFFAIGYPTMPGIIWLVLSMIVYGVAFDFFNISGSLFVDQYTDSSIRSSAQGLFFLCTNGLGSSLGMLMAQGVVNHFTENVDGLIVGNWPAIWTIFAAYALVLAILFALLFRFEPAKKAN